MRIILTILLFFFAHKSYGYKISNYNHKICGFSYHIMDNSKLDSYSVYVRKIISKKLSSRQIALLKEIIITDSYIYDSIANDGVCIIQDSFTIIVSTISDFQLNLFHELSHVMQFSYDDVWKEIKKDWQKCKEYITNYAVTNIDEDFAEVGSYCLTGHYNPKNAKYELFKKFLNRIE
jgi:hypothetical protein